MAGEAAGQSQAAPPPFTGWRLAVITLALALAVFMNVLDTSIANVSVPTIAGYLAVSADQGTWVITSFAVSNAIAVPISGWLSKRVGEVKLFVICTLLFTVTSWMCGISFTFPMLLVSRILQGAVAGPMIPLSQSLLLGNYPPDKRGLANGIWGMTAVVGPVAGPILGGWITDDYNWSWIFYINVPIGIVAATVTWLMLRSRETERQKLPIDLIGLSLLVLGVACFQIMLDKGNDNAWFQSTFIVEMAVVAVVALTFLVAWELTDANPVVDFRLFSNRNFAIATIVVTVGYMVYFGGVVILPLWLQTEMGYNPTWAGITTSSLGIFGIVASPVIGRLSDKLDARVLVSIGMVVFAAVSFWNSGYNTQVSFYQLFVPRLAWGFGLACFFIPLITLSLADIPREHVASASGLFNFMRLIALAVGTSLSQKVWDDRMSLHDHHLTENLSVFDPTTHRMLAQLQSLGLDQAAALKQLSTVVSKQAYMLATNDVFWLSGWLFLSLIILVWMARSPKAAKK